MLMLPLMSSDGAMHGMKVHAHDHCVMACLLMAPGGTPQNPDAAGRLCCKIFLSNLVFNPPAILQLCMTCPVYCCHAAATPLWLS